MECMCRGKVKAGDMLEHVKSCKEFQAMYGDLCELLQSRIEHSNEAQLPVLGYYLSATSKACYRKAAEEEKHADHDHDHNSNDCCTILFSDTKRTFPSFCSRSSSISNSGSDADDNST